MKSNKNTWGKQIKAWYLRNFVYADLLTIKLNDDFKPALFEIMRVSEGGKFLYLGNNKYKPIHFQ